MKKLLLVIILLVMVTDQSFALDLSAHPLEGQKYRITSVFGYRTHPLTYERKMHNGIDFGASSGTPVFASNDGEIKTGFEQSMGHYIKIIEDSENYSIYMHLKSVSVESGGFVIAGEEIGTVGSTGYSTGPHLHFGVKIDGDYRNPEDYFTSKVADKEDVNYSDFPFQFRSLTHTTGSVRLIIEGVFPIKVYKSLDRESWVFMEEVTDNEFIEFGLENGKTYYYKLVDGLDREAISRYTPPDISMQQLPLQLKQLNDTEAHISWTHFDNPVSIVLDGNKINESVTFNEMTITGLEPDSKHTVYFLNELDERSNTITFTTTKELSRLAELLEKIFVPEWNVDHDSDGIPDKLEKITDQVDEIKNKLGGETVKNVEAVFKEIPEGMSKEKELLDELPKVEFDYYDVHWVVLDLADPIYYDWYDFIRSFCLMILTIAFMFRFLSYFDVDMKV